MKDFTKIRLQKRIAESGYCSRRKAEALMQAGKVKVNGAVVSELGTKVTASDQIEVSGKKLRFQNKAITIMLHKPEGYLTSKSDPHHAQTVMNLLPKNLQSLKPAGRLDKASEGLLLLSNQGELIQKLTHPKHGHQKTYEILVKGWPKEENLFPLKKGMQLDGKTLNPMDYKIIRTLASKKTWLELTLSEGRKRQIRRVMDQLGFPVLYLKRTAIGQLKLGQLQPGEFKALSQDDIQLALS